MLHHETPVNKRQIALTAGFVGYVSEIELEEMIRIIKTVKGI